MCGYAESISAPTGYYWNTYNLYIDPADYTSYDDWDYSWGDYDEYNIWFFGNSYGSMYTDYWNVY